MYGYARGFGHDHKIGVLVFNLNILRDARRFVAMHEVPDASGLRHHHIFPHGEALHPQMARRDGPLVVRPGPEWKILKEDIEERPLGPASFGVGNKVVPGRGTGCDERVMKVGRWEGGKVGKWEGMRS
jgi:hypothetical protein